MKTKKLILLVTLMVLLVGVASATEVSEDNVNTIDTTSVDEIVQDTPTITEEVKTNSKVTFEAQLTADNQPVTRGKVIFKINGKTLKDTNGKIIYAQVDENGTATIDYTLTATYINTKYEKLTDESTLRVVKA